MSDARFVYNTDVRRAWLKIIYVVNTLVILDAVNLSIISVS